MKNEYKDDICYVINYFDEEEDEFYSNKTTVINTVDISDYVDIINNNKNIDEVISNLSDREISKLVIASLYYNKHEVLDILLSKYFDINTFYDYEISIFHMRNMNDINEDTYNVLKKYIKDFKYINLKDGGDYTPLMISFRDNNINMVKLFLETFIDKIIYDDSLNTIMYDINDIYEYDDIINLILDTKLDRFYINRTSGKKFLFRYIGYLIRTCYSNKLLYKFIKKGMDISGYYSNIFIDNKHKINTGSLFDVTVLLLDSGSVSIEEVVDSLIKRDLGNLILDIIIAKPELYDKIMSLIPKRYKRTRWFINITMMANNM
ncbi:MAG: hypothetical protein QXD03_03220 [Candidatus Anstonellales archaeon]